MKSIQYTTRPLAAVMAARKLKLLKEIIEDKLKDEQRKSEEKRVDSNS